jgi:CheY-like chemotaxis protein
MAEKKKYDIVLMDINLGPGIDGLETMDRIREIDGYFNIPVVAVTGYTMAADRKKIMNRGCDYFLGKPFTREDLELILDKAGV